MLHRFMLPDGSFSGADESHDYRLDEITKATDILNKNPGNLDAYLQRARLYKSMERLPEAVIDYTDALKYLPDGQHEKKAGIYTHRGEAHYALNNLGQALIDLHRAMDCAPGSKMAKQAETYLKHTILKSKFKLTILHALFKIKDLEIQEQLLGQCLDEMTSLGATFQQEKRLLNKISTQYQTLQNREKLDEWVVLGEEASVSSDDDWVIVHTKPKENDIHEDRTYDSRL